jgi:recombination protein RecA
MPSQLEERLAALRKKDKALRVGSITELQEYTGQSFPTGNVAMDLALGVNGFPQGKVIELYGISMSGKTTMALQTIACHQARLRTGEAAGAVLYLDYEHSLDQGYCQDLGIDTEDADTFIYVQPETFEQGAQLFRDLAAAGLLAFAVFDSVAAMVPRSELEAESGAYTFGDRARSLHQFFRQAKGLMARTGTSVIMLNHVMDKIDTSPMGRRLAAQGVKRSTTPGGTSIEFYADVRVVFTRIGDLKTREINPVSLEEEKLVTATDVKALVLKNKVATPQKLAWMRVRYGKGFSEPYSVLMALLGHGRVTKTESGGWYTFPAELSPTGEKWRSQEEPVLTRLETDTAWFRKMEDLARTLVSDDNPQEQQA